MNYSILRIDAENYSLFSDMIHWRMTGEQRKPTFITPSNEIQSELLNPNLFLYGIKADDILVGWISLIYLPKVGKFNGHGHIYVDELWIEPSYRGNGFAKVLMKKADELAKDLEASGIRLYVNTENPTARNLYQKCGYIDSGTAYFMEK